MPQYRKKSDPVSIEQLPFDPGDGSDIHQVYVLGGSPGLQLLNKAQVDAEYEDLTETAAPVPSDVAPSETAPVAEDVPAETPAWQPAPTG